MLSKILPEFKFPLPIAAIVVSPLLLAAAQPPALDTELETNGIYCHSATTANVTSQSATAPESPLAPGSIATQTHVLATSQQELAAFLANRLATALQLLQSNPYATNLATPVRLNNSAAAEADLGNCPTTLTLQTSLQPEIQLALVPGSSVALALQLAPAPTSIASESVSESFAELPDLSTPSPAPSSVTPAAPLPAPLTLPTNTPPVPSLPPAPIESELLPDRVIEAQPAVPIAVPPVIAPTNNSPSESIDPSNFTPTTAEPTPFDGDLPKTLAAIPDGNYRYIAGEAENRIYSEAELQQRGSAVFLLRKEGTTITGDLSPRLGLAGICITGAVSGDVVSGEAYPYETDGSTPAALPEGETLQIYGDGVLQVQRATRVEGKGLYYANAVLDLANFSRINVGSTLPPASCSL